MFVPIFVKHELRNVNDMLIWTTVKNVHRYVEDVLKNVVKFERRSYFWVIAYFWAIGKPKLNVAPLPSELFSAHILPPWASTILLEIYNPKPVPEFDLVANLVNSLGIISGCIPSPVSLTAIMTSWFSSLLFLFSVVTDMIPPLCDVNFMALFMRLDMAWLILPLSASTIYSQSLV